MDNNLIAYILQHNKKKNNNLKYDFMPSLLEIIERPAHKAGTIIIIGVFSLLVVMCVWACLSEVDVVVVAKGSIQPQGDLKVINASSSGIIEKINIIEGQLVEKGENLIEFNSEVLKLTNDHLITRKNELEVYKDIYLRITEGEDISELDIEEYDPDCRASIRAIIDMDISYHNALENLDKERDTADLNRQIAQIQLEEYEKNGTSRQSDSQELLIEQYSLSIEEIDIKFNDSETQYQVQINSKISEIEQELLDIESELKKSEIENNYQQLRSPVKGYINSIEVNTEGETVSSGEKIISILPIDVPVEMTCYVKNMDIADIKIGMETAIKLEAYPYSKYGTIQGVVKYISPSSFMSEQLGSIYMVKLEIDNDNPNINVISGLSGTAEIKTRRRTIMEYFLEPITNGLENSLKEK